MQSELQKQIRLATLVARAEQSFEQAIVSARRTGRVAPVRHKCFITYHSADIDAVSDFVEAYNDVFIPRVVGVSDSDHFRDPVDSDDEEYVKRQIREKYLTDSTVTILFVGRCAWARKFVDWEISSSLRDDKWNKRSGLIAITPKDNAHNTVPQRFSDDYVKGDATCYARYYYYYPTTADNLRLWIEDAYRARDDRGDAVRNGRELRKVNSAC